MLGLVERSLQKLLPLISRRFRSFSEATDAALDVLASELPGEIVLGQIEPGEDVMRVLDVRGAAVVGIERGIQLPLAGRAEGGGAGGESIVLEGVHADEDLEPAHLRALGLAEWIAVPLEMSDGAIAGMVTALSRREGEYGAEHVVLLGLTARMLAYEWERVRNRTELRELRQRVGAGDGMDPDTGLAGRYGFVELLDREWRLARRGTFNTMVAAFRVSAGDAAPDSPMALLALKDAAEALAGAVRTTDHIGRIGDMDLAVALVGAPDEASVEPLVRRFTDALRRVTRGRPVVVSVSSGAASLAESPSPEQGLEHALRGAAGETTEPRGEPVPAGGDGP
jgi:GGDEF domain-containing protein